MKKTTKILSLVLAFVLCVGVGVGATLAWLSAETAQVKNTFYAEGLINGEGKFDLKEHDVNYDTTTGIYTQNTGKEVDAVNYKVTPANNLPKDPFVRIQPSEKAYVFIAVKSTLPETMGWSVDTSNWTKIENKNNAIEGDVYVMNEVAAKDVETMKYILTDNTITVSPELDPATVTAETALTFNAYAVQYIGFESGAQAAWDATFGATK